MFILVLVGDPGKQGEWDAIKVVTADEGVSHLYDACETFALG